MDLFVTLSKTTFSIMTLGIGINCHYAACHYAECHYTECRYPECRYAECNYAECYYAETSITNLKSPGDRINNTFFFVTYKFAQ